jgi:acyl-CoA synthetase (AMP-forming)/AMP-acid ligase II
MGQAAITRLRRDRDALEVVKAVKRSYNEIHDSLCGPGQFFEIETLDIDGVLTRTWKNAPVNLAQVLEQGALNAGSRDFIVLGGERLTHERHLELVHRLAATLVHELRVEKGDRVAIAMRNLPEWSVAFFAATMVGAIAVPLNAFWNGEELAFGVADCQPRILFADGERLERLSPHVAALENVLVVGTNLDDRKGMSNLPEGIRAFDALLEGEDAGPIDIDVRPDDPATIFLHVGNDSQAKGRPRHSPQHL